MALICLSVIGKKYRQEGRLKSAIQRGLFAVAAVAVLFGAGAANAQQYPSQDIHFICGFAPGSGADIIVRFYAEKVRVLSGRNIIVENRVGAIGNIATEYVARSKPDG